MIRLKTVSYCIHYFDNNNLNLFSHRRLSYCMSKSQPRAKKTISHDLGYLLSLRDISNEITKYLLFSDILTIASLNQLTRASITDKFQFVFTPAEFSNPEHPKLRLAIQGNLNLKITVKILKTSEDIQNLTCLIQNANNLSFVSHLETIRFIYVNQDTQNAIQTLLNLIPDHLPCLANLSFLGIWKPIVFPCIKLASLSLGKIWSPIFFLHAPQIDSLLFEKVTNQPNTKKMLEDLQASSKSGNIAKKTSN